ncbi:hypothetical protein Spica_2742 [Gracilinema caldarium DSM 7334]|uniref:Putative auto-transporter adhesin head GIN domain-containing protein n=2 Tax=Gracilinema caldarium TaxID=215591 RepID=F8F148_GRAC1|nr:hypothetical protein Spica_2742 [Gracilinema caldarium DSM 7334]
MVEHMKSLIKYGIVLAALIGVGVVFTNTLQQKSGRGLTLPAIQLPSIPLPFGSTVSLSGQIVEESRPITAFTTLKIPGTGKVTIRLGATPSLLIRADKSLLDKLTTEQQGSTLTLSQKSGIGFTINSPIEYEITTPSLQDISIAGSATVNVLDTLTGPVFTIEIAGSGDIRAALDVDTATISIMGAGKIELSGRTKKLSHTVLGSGDLKGEKLDGTEAKITILGSGNTSIGTFDSLDVTIAGSGDVIYSGNPRIQSKTPGSGKIRSR